jgi:hypothetical protein
MPDMSGCASWRTMCTTARNASSTLLEGLCAMAEDPPSSHAHSPDATEPEPIMKMYLHAGIADYVLFHHFLPRTGAQFFAALLFTLLLGLVRELLKAVQARWVARLRARPRAQRPSGPDISPSSSRELLSPGEVELTSPASLHASPAHSIRAAKAFLSIFHSLISYALMVSGWGRPLRLCSGSDVDLVLIHPLPHPHPHASTTQLVVMTFNIYLIMAAVLGIAGGVWLFDTDGPHCA